MSTATATDRLTLKPITHRRAKAFVREHHRHCDAPAGAVHVAGVFAGGELVGVGISGRPVARMLDDGATVEITRVCTTGHRNACSMLYAALCRAAAALGYTRAVTYTLADEPGSSVRAAGFAPDGGVKAEATWSRTGRPRSQEKRDAGRKQRWRKAL